MVPTIRILAAALAALLGVASAKADVITRLPTNELVVALTFDACEAGKPVHFDRKVLDFLLERRIPFTIFASGRFVETNPKDIAELSKLDFVEIENHSWNHPNTMDLLSPAAVQKQIVRTDDIIEQVTGRRPRFFRFPAGRYDAAALKEVEGLGHGVVHWRWATGDPDPKEGKNALIHRVAAKTQPGDILIFHINGRGVHTGEALPTVIADLEARGYRFAKLSDYLGRDQMVANEETIIQRRFTDYVGLLSVRFVTPGQ